MVIVGSAQKGQVIKMLIHLENVTKTYKDKVALKLEELKIEEGRIYGIVGKNGAGKTTLFRLLAGLSFPTTGEIRCELENFRPGIMIEMPAIDLDMTARENLMWAAKVYGQEVCRDIEEVLALVRLRDVNTKAKKFSLGMKQRLGIAMSLISNPQLMILDEPMNGLDPAGMVELRNILLEINRLGKTILISSHMLEELYKLASDYIFIKDGHIVKEITAADLEAEQGQDYELVTSDNEKAIRILEEQWGCSVTRKSEELLFSLKDQNILAISKSLAAHEVYILKLFQKKFSIEEYYMKIMGENM